MSLSIIIVNWNSTDYLRRCLASIYRETKGLIVEIAVIDNASRDDSCGELIRGEFPGVILHCSDKNLGFARGSNLGYELSSGEILLFLNPDTEIQSDVFTRMVKELESTSCIGAVGSRLLNSDGSLQTSCIQSYPTILNQLLDSKFLRHKFPTSRLWGMQPLFANPTSPARVDVISGACLMVKREVFAQVGKFDDSYFMYVEDVDLCRRITGAGYTIHYMNDCEVIHHGGKSSAVQGRHFASLRQQKAILQFFAATQGRWYSFLYRVGVALAAATRLAIIVSLVPFRIVAHTAINWKFSFRKWTCIFRWAIGLESLIATHAARMEQSTMIGSSSMSVFPSHPRIALITPLRDEEDYIEGMVVSIVKQQVRPAKWLIVDDGSTDKTPVIVRAYCQQFEFIELLELPVRSERNPGGEGAIAYALQRLDVSGYDYLARFDADLLFEEDYFGRILAEFEKDQRLGIAGGGLYIDRNRKLVLERAPEYHVRGAVKMYRRECFEQLCGLDTDIGWDTIDEVYAWSRGWRTRSFFDIRVIHRRPTGESLHASRIYRERGRAEYLTWSHPMFVLLKSVKIARGSFANARYFLSGFFHSYKMRHLRLADPDFRRTRRSQQLARAFNSVIPSGSAPLSQRAASQHGDRY